MRRALLAPALALVALASAPARADDYVTVRGAYYREPSTRVIQPIVEVERDSESGVDVKAHFLVDTITSASIAAGTLTDNIFTETRNEQGLAIRVRRGYGEAIGSYRYSAESDYWSHTAALSLVGRLWEDTARVSVSLSRSWDSLAWSARTPCKAPPDITCDLDTTYWGVGYTQILTPLLLAQVSFETAHLDGFQGNLYRSVPNFGYEKVPSTRVRNALALRVAYHVLATDTTLRLHYRHYVDSWAIDSNTAELRVYQPVSSTVELRFGYRTYRQTAANFWCDALKDPGCYPPSSVYYTTDPKLGPVRTQYPEVQVVWLASALGDVPVLNWIAAGTFQVSYGYFIQSTSFKNAHLLQMGYTMPY